MKAKILYRHREDFDDGAIMEVVIWHLPRPVPDSSHPFKYRLFYGYVGKRLIGYDNEHGKGDHRHHEKNKRGQSKIKSSVIPLNYDQRHQI